MFEAENIRDWRNHDVIDADGSKIGQLEAIYVDTGTDMPAFASVRIGMLGRHRLTFVPLDRALAATDEPGLFAHYGLAYQPGASGERRLARR
jgi:hypothetical protein